MLDYVPARLRVIRVRRPKYGCRACGNLHQAPTSERPIAKGLATAGLLAHMIVSKYCDHVPLYRQSQIFARQGVTLNRSTLANWVGGAAWWLEPLHARLVEQVFASSKLFADDTTVPVFDPGRGRTRTGRPAMGWDRSTGRRLLLQPRPQSRTAGGSSQGVQRHPAGRRLRRLLTTDDERHHLTGSLLGAYAAQVLRRPSDNRLADRRGGATPDRRVVRHRAFHPRQTTRRTAARSQRAIMAADR